MARHPDGKTCLLLFAFHSQLKSVKAGKSQDQYKSKTNDVLQSVVATLAPLQIDSVFEYLDDINNLQKRHK